MGFEKPIRKADVQLKVFPKGGIRLSQGQGRSQVVPAILVLLESEPGPAPVVQGLEVVGLHG